MTREQLRGLRAGDRVQHVGPDPGVGTVVEVVYDHGVRVRWDDDGRVGFFDYTDTCDGTHTPAGMLKIKGRW